MKRSWIAIAIVALQVVGICVLGPRVGPLWSNVCQFALGVVALVMVTGAARRSGHFGRQVWIVTAGAVAIWVVAQALITYLDSIAHWSFDIPWPSDAPVFLWAFALLACLFVEEESSIPGFDWTLAVDFGQVLVLALALQGWLLAAPSLWQVAPGSMMSLTRDTRNLRDALILAVLLGRALFTRSRVVRALFLRLSGFMLLYAIADIVYHYGEDMWGVETGSLLDVLWTIPFLYLSVVACKWGTREEESVNPSNGLRRTGRALLTIVGTLLPIPITLLSISLMKEQPRAAFSYITAAVLLSALRLWMTQIRQKRVEKLQQALYRISETSRSAPDLPALFQSIHEILGDLMYARNCYIAIHNPVTDLIDFPYFVDEVDHEVPAPRPRSSSRGLTEYLLRAGQPLLATPDVLEELERQGEVIRIGAPSLDWVGVPLQSGDTTFGVLALQSYESHVRYGRSELKILTFVSQQIASAVSYKQASQAIRESESNFRALAENASAAIYIFDEKRLLYANPGAVNITEYSVDELLDMSMISLVHPDDRERMAIRLIQRMADEPVSDRVEFRVLTKSGKVRWVDSGGSALTFRGRPARIGVAVDITDRKVMEDQLRQAVKMEAVGRLAGGIAHDFNNLLTIISGYSQLQLDSTASEEPLHQHAEQIKGAADRAAALTSQLLAFSRQQVMQPQVVDLNVKISGFAKMMPRLIGDDMHLETHLAPDLDMVKVDPGQIDQVLLNMVVNARDAMPKGGTIRIETANVEFDRGYAETHSYVEPGHYVMLSVNDTGVGIDPATRAHIFEPFFTTKSSGKGTGLGLSTVYGIVKQSGGSIEVYSELSHGTTFMIYFPRVSGQVPSPVKPAVPREKASETILLVEDDNQLRELARTILLSRGYKILVVDRPENAVSICTAHPEKIDLLLTDVVMPGISGKEVADAVQQLRPEIKVLFMSGYTTDRVVQQGVLAEGRAFLQKPFSPFTLISKIRQVLDHQAEEVRSWTDSSS